MARYINLTEALLAAFSTTIAATKPISYIHNRIEMLH